MDTNRFRQSDRDYAVAPEILLRALRVLTLLCHRRRLVHSELDGRSAYSLADMTLREAGISDEELEWLLDVGYVASIDSQDMTSPTGLRKLDTLLFDGAFYVITTAGAAFIDEVSNAVSVSTTEILRRDATGQLVVIPRWNAERRELTYRGTLVKRFRKSAPNQECLLNAFERQGWPRRIADPLPFEITVVPVDRLHDAIKRLNRTLDAPLLNFGGDGKGTGVCWRVVTPPLQDEL